jgi:DNA-directed RNA polymerase specialized sigma24 family protein
VSAWDRAFEASATALIQRVLDGDRAAWRSLLVMISPRIEEWARTSRVLRRCRLSSDDDARAVMVDVLERLARDGYANLKAFVERAVLAEPRDALVDQFVRLTRLDGEDDAEPRDLETGTPLRAWLLRLVDFAARDHVRHRLGWSAGTDEPTKRDLGTDAQRLDAVREPAHRPPITDRVTMSAIVEEVQAQIETFPQDMQAALVLWLEDASFGEIASHLLLPDPGRARALIRAGQARLRAHFRGRTPLLFSAAD